MVQGCCCIPKKYILLRISPYIGQIWRAVDNKKYSAILLFIFVLTPIADSRLHLAITSVVVGSIPTHSNMWHELMTCPTMILATEGIKKYNSAFLFLQWKYPGKKSSFLDHSYAHNWTNQFALLFLFQVMELAQYKVLGIPLMLCKLYSDINHEHLYGILGIILQHIMDFSEK